MMQVAMRGVEVAMRGMEVAERGMEVEELVLQLRQVGVVVVAKMVSEVTDEATRLQEHMEGRTEGLVAAVAVAAVAAAGQEVLGLPSLLRFDSGNPTDPRGKTDDSHGMQSRRVMYSHSRAWGMTEGKQAEALGKEELPRQNSPQTRCCGLWSNNHRGCSGWKTS